MTQRTPPFSGGDASSTAEAFGGRGAAAEPCVRPVGRLRPSRVQRGCARLLTLVLPAAVALAAATAAPPAYAQCGSRLSLEDAARLQTQLLHALGAEDRTTFDALTTPDLVLIEHGRIQDRDGLYGQIVEVHQGGGSISWSVTQAHVEAGCDVAVMRYLDVGALRPGGRAAVPVQWLETAAFRREGARWRIFQMTSERVVESASGGDGRGAAASPSPRG